MITEDCRRLAEADFPIGLVSKQASEKSSPKGYPFMLHLWWARRPLGACRAILLSALLPDPCDPKCPEAFKASARRLLSELQGKIENSDSDLREALLCFIGDYSSWELSSNQKYINVGKSLVECAYEGDPPIVNDPFSGGGSIPLEALRLGCESSASDINPVSCLMLKVLLEDIPRRGVDLADELRDAGKDILNRTKTEMRGIFPADPDGEIPIAYLWARTIRCEAPKCGAEIPIYRSPWLSKKGATKARYFKESREGQCKALLIESCPVGGPVEFRIAVGEGSEHRKSGFVELIGTKAKGNSANVSCPCCGSVVPGSKKNPRVQAQLSSQEGGTDVIFDDMGDRCGGARLLAVVTNSPKRPGRRFRLPSKADYQAVYEAREYVTKLLDQWHQEGRSGLCPVPDEPLPPIGTLGFRVQRYGMKQWGHLFTWRQKAVLIAVSRWLGEFDDPALVRCLACAFSRLAMSNMSCTRWNATAEKMQHTFGRQALPIVWDFAEVVPTASAPGNWQSGFELVAEVIEACPQMQPAEVQQADAANSPLPDESVNVWFTDPPYYDAVPYADLSDFFFVWFKRISSEVLLMSELSNDTMRLTPKEREIVQDKSKKIAGVPKDKLFFETAMGQVFAEGRRVLKKNGIGCVVFAHKTTEGWEALLSGMIRGGWTITGSWPITTEMGSRLRARDSAALATSVHLICRPRPEGERIGDWGDVLSELPNRVGHWMERLQSEGVRGADLVFACIGPALEIFSRFERVETPDGSDVTLTDYLEKVWEVVGRMALETILGTAEAMVRNGAAGALEEDARLTALFLWTLQDSNPAAGDASDGKTDAINEDADDLDEPEGKPKGFSLVYDVVRRFAQPLGIELPKWENRIIEIKKGVVRLLPVAERTKQLFGEEGAQSVALRIEQGAELGEVSLQGVLFPELEQLPPKVKGRGRGKARTGGSQVSDDRLAAPAEATTLDRVHAAMLLQSGGRTQALRALLKFEQERGPDFLRLANALSALYPKGTQEKRLLDAMLLAIPR